MPVYKFTDGRKGWYFQFYFEGKKIKKERWKGEHMNTKAEAIAAEAECKDQLIHANDLPQITLYELFDEYISSVKSSIKESSKRDYVKFRLHYLILMPDILIYDLTIKDVLKFRNELDRMELAITYKNRQLNFMKAILNYGQLIYNIKGNLQIPLLEPFKNNNVVIVNTKKENLPQAEFDRMVGLLDINDNTQFYYFVVLNVLYYTGMRIGELAALTEEDYINSSFVINKDYVRVSGVDYIQSPKNMNSVRTILLDEKTNELVNEYIRRLQPKGQLFHLEGKYLNQQRLRRILEKLSSEANLNEEYYVHPHGLRHSHASNLRLLGYDEFTISKRLGNTPAIAASTYIHADDNEQIEMVKKLRS